MGMEAKGTFTHGPFACSWSGWQSVEGQPFVKNVWIGVIDDGKTPHDANTICFGGTAKCGSDLDAARDTGRTGFIAELDKRIAEMAGR